VAKRSDDVWYVKPHPAQPDDSRLAKEIFGHLPNVTILPSTADNSQLIDEGVAAVVTINGSIAVEFALRSVPVIACAKVAPYQKFGFAHFPPDTEHLQEMLLNPEQLSPLGEPENALAFYSYVNFYNPQSKFFTNYFDVMRKVKTEGQGFAYQEFEREFTRQPELIESRIESLQEFFRNPQHTWYRKPR
jgi:hypothetical protein